MSQRSTQRPPCQRLCQLGVQRNPASISPHQLEGSRGPSGVPAVDTLSSGPAQPACPRPALHHRWPPSKPLARRHRCLGRSPERCRRWLPRPPDQFCRLYLPSHLHWPCSGPSAGRLRRHGRPPGLFRRHHLPHGRPPERLPRHHHWFNGQLPDCELWCGRSPGRPPKLLCHGLLSRRPPGRPPDLCNSGLMCGQPLGRPPALGHYELLCCRPLGCLLTLWFCFWALCPEPPPPAWGWLFCVLFLLCFAVEGHQESALGGGSVTAWISDPAL